MNAVFETAALVQSTFDSRGWQSCIIGALAVIRWGETRATRDVNVSLLTGIGDERRFIDAILETFQPRCREAAELAEEARILLVRAPGGVEVDVSFAAFPLERRMIERSTVWTPAPGATFRTLSPEDVILMKAFAGRGRDWSDIEGVIVRQGPRLDWQYNGREIDLLAAIKPEVDFVAQLNDLRRQLES